MKDIRIMKRINAVMHMLEIEEKQFDRHTSKCDSKIKKTQEIKMKKLLVFDFNIESQPIVSRIYITDELHISLYKILQFIVRLHHVHYR